jgi:hypothetical protein
LDTVGVCSFGSFRIHFLDAYLEGEVDLHRVLWLATANDLSLLHPAVLDRFRILEMPDPEAGDLFAVLPRLICNVPNAGDWLRNG